jgi:hypothetical protein
MSLRRWFRRPGHAAAARPPVDDLGVGARLELDVVELSGTARDLGDGEVFFQTSAPIARGVRGTLRRDGSPDRLRVRVSYQRAPRPGRPAGLGLVFE